MSLPHDTIEDTKKENRNLRYIIYVLIALFGATLFLAVLLQKEVDNLKIERCKLKGYKQAWIDFNKSYIPNTALPRLPEIEAIYEEGK